jgi:hypothetical protein
MEVMGLMLGDFVDEYTVKVVDVFAMPQSGTGVSVEAVDPVFQTTMLDMLKQVRLSYPPAHLYRCEVLSWPHLCYLVTYVLACKVPFSEPNLSRNVATLRVHLTFSGKHLVACTHC